MECKVDAVEIANKIDVGAKNKVEEEISFDEALNKTSELFYQISPRLKFTEFPS